MFFFGEGFLMGGMMADKSSSKREADFMGRRFFCIFFPPESI
jgi:hypothetical protein